ncbi:MAG: bifunctional DNA-formamidopyrimidine glycosylase/DNA-(apurinic or apyrimidinic site) lyase [Phycisphaeraceae bacterium]|nr:bifunctional DNA-formamidopyrimidine glycosylase/DNA-(apurinic or apyrimidinic site) lyase [Phycisphaeraceae bacterium]
MPELPEVEHLVRTLRESVLGRRVIEAVVRRRDVVSGRAEPDDLLVGRSIDRIIRHGKQFALLSDDQDGPAICVHLGMTGSMRITPIPAVGDARCDGHDHVIWRLDDGRAMVFRDPRRFGGIWCFDDERSMRDSRWSLLGPDALLIDASALTARMRGTRRAVKAALLDQRLVAGLGNIYVDEALFLAEIHPLPAAALLSRPRVARLVEAIRRVLEAAIEAGGSSLRDYIDALGRSGRFQSSHRVYGRGGLPCVRCGRALRTRIIATRTTVYCPRCQRR